MNAISGSEDEEDVGSEDSGEGERECRVREEETLDRMSTEVLVGLKVHHKPGRDEQYQGRLK